MFKLIEIGIGKRSIFVVCGFKKWAIVYIYKAWQFLNFEHKRCRCKLNVGVKKWGTQTGECNLAQGKGGHHLPATQVTSIIHPPG